MAGKSYREGPTLLQIADMFGNEDDAREWLESKRWPDGVTCPRSGSVNVVKTSPFNPDASLQGLSQGRKQGPVQCQD
ncbi:MAG: transposase [Gammaproteobacteria bacterium]|nr:transposase [Gammaproteobacteria bacterium]MCY4227339.1 transposase [Gammaproteobacteria bacterium]